MSIAEPCSRNDAERGIALVVVLWMLALIAVLMLVFVSDARTELQIARNQEETARARAMADAGVTLAILGMLDPSTATRWHADGETHDVNFGSGKLRITVQDEGGKIDLNTAPPDRFAGLFRTLGLPDDQATELVAAIMARRNAASTGGGAAGAGGDAVDAASGAAAPASQKPFLTIDELRLLPGVTPALYDRLRPFITIYANGTQINSLTAPAKVLESLGIDPGTVADFIAARDSIDATSGVLPSLNGASGIAGAVVQVFTVTSQGITTTGARFIREAVVTAGEAAQVLSWRQAPSPPTASP